MARGFVYLTTVVDAASRKMLAHKAAIALEATQAKEALVDFETTVECLYEIKMHGPFAGGAIHHLVREACASLILTAPDKDAICCALIGLPNSASAAYDRDVEHVASLLSAYDEFRCLRAHMLAKALSAE